MGRVSSTAASTLGSGVNSPAIQVVSVIANTEATITIPAGARRYTLQLRDGKGFEVRYSSGSSEFWTVSYGNCYQELDLSPTSSYIVYITPPRDGTLEVLSWA